MPGEGFIIGVRVDKDEIATRAVKYIVAILVKKEACERLMASGATGLKCGDVMRGNGSNNLLR